MWVRLIHLLACNARGAVPGNRSRTRPQGQCLNLSAPFIQYSMSMLTKALQLPHQVNSARAGFTGIITMDERTEVGELCGDTETRRNHKDGFILLNWYAGKVTSFSLGDAFFTLWWGGELRRSWPNTPPFGREPVEGAPRTAKVLSISHFLAINLCRRGG